MHFYIWEPLVCGLLWWMWASGCLNSCARRGIHLLIPNLVHTTIVWVTWRHSRRAICSDFSHSQDCAEPLQWVWALGTARTLHQLCRKSGGPTGHYGMGFWNGQWWPPSNHFPLFFYACFYFAFPVQWNNLIGSSKITFYLSSQWQGHQDVLFSDYLTRSKFPVVPISGFSLRFLLFPGRCLFFCVLGTAFGVIQSNSASV